MLIEWLPLLLLGLGFGLIHALDADHVMAVSALANQNPSIKRTLFFSAYWALGHGGVLLICGVILFGFGIAVPETFANIAELLVGVLLIILGLSFFWQSRRQKIHVTKHTHNDVEHTHLVSESHSMHAHVVSDNSDKATAQYSSNDIIKGHQPVMVGVLHGLAGSAPALALIPAVAYGELSLAVMYLLVFSVGVMASMLLFGLGFSWVQHYLYQYYARLFIGCRYLVAVSAIGFGSFWLVQAAYPWLLKKQPLTEKTSQ